MKMIKLLALTGLIVSALAGNMMYAGEKKTYGYESKEKRIAAKRVRTKSQERRKRWLEASKKTEANLKNLQKKADIELNEMSPAARKKTEQQMASVQRNIKETIARLEAMAPEERNAELKKMQAQSDKVMTQLKKENPDAYKTFKSMEKMGDAMENLATGELG